MEPNFPYQVPDRQISPDEGLSRAEWQERLDDFNSDLYEEDEDVV